MPVNPPFRADHVGSLLRPPELIEARDAFDAGQLSRERLRALEDRAIRDVVALQEGVGLRSVTDGELRRRSFWYEFLVGFEGVEISYEASEGWDFVDEHGHRMKAPKAAVRGKLRHVRSTVTDEFEFLRSVTRGTPKVTIPSPVMLHYYGGRDAIDRETYPDLDAFWDDLVAVYHDELRALHEKGCRYVQIDETSTAKLCDPNIREVLRKRGDDPDALVRLYAGVVDRIVSGRPDGMTVGIHLCRGNQRGHWQASGGYDFVAEVLFNEIGADCYFLEYDTPRAGDFSPLRYLPDDKVAVLGLISTKTAALEDRDTLRRRLDEASAFVPLDRLCLSPQCGFSSGMYGNPITIDDERRKLELLVSVAAEVWNGEEPRRKEAS